MPPPKKKSERNVFFILVYFPYQKINVYRGGASHIDCLVRKHFMIHYLAMVLSPGLVVFLDLLFIPFWVFLGTIWGHFGDILLLKFQQKKCYVFEDVPGANVGAPGHHHRVKKLVFHWRVVQNRGSAFSRWCAHGSGFGCQNRPKIDQKWH